MHSSKILIVDDSTVVRKMVKSALQKACDEVSFIEADSGLSAVDVASANKPNMAILDYNIPDFDGLTLAKELRSSSPDIPLLLITSNMKEEIQANAKSMDVGFLTKPISPADRQQFYDGIGSFVNGNLVEQPDDDVVVGELELDFFGEIMNLGTGRALPKLCECFGDKTCMSVPTKELVARKDILKKLSLEETSEITAVHANYTGGVNGEAMLLTTPENRNNIIRAYFKNLNTDIPASSEKCNEALLTIAEIAIESILVTMRDMCDMILVQSPLKLDRGVASNLLHPWIHANNLNEQVVFLHISLLVETISGTADLYFFLDCEANESLFESIRMQLDFDF